MKARSRRNGPGLRVTAQSFSVTPRIVLMTARRGSAMSGEFSSMNRASTSGRARRSSHSTAGRAIVWTESLPASPMRPSPRPV
eukprot:9364032-Alexandrium_andersonii.AAC.1